MVRRAEREAARLKRETELAEEEVRATEREAQARLETEKAAALLAAEQVEREAVIAAEKKAERDARYAARKAAKKGAATDGVGLTEMVRLVTPLSRVR